MKCMHIVELLLHFWRQWWRKEW